MRFDNARIDKEKITDYLLGSSSVAAIGKARLFGRMGFSAQDWEQLAAALRRQASQAAVEIQTSDWGSKYVATGPIDGPNGGSYKIVSVWIDDGTGLRLVTAYPFKE